MKTNSERYFLSPENKIEISYLIKKDFIDDFTSPPSLDEEHIKQYLEINKDNNFEIKNISKNKKFEYSKEQSFNLLNNNKSYQKLNENINNNNIDIEIENNYDNCKETEYNIKETNFIGIKNNKINKLNYEEEEKKIEKLINKIKREKKNVKILMNYVKKKNKI